MVARKNLYGNLISVNLPKFWRAYISQREDVLKMYLKVFFLYAEDIICECPTQK